MAAINDDAVAQLPPAWQVATEEGKASRARVRSKDSTHTQPGQGAGAQPGLSGLRGLLEPRVRPGFGLPELISFLTYCGLLAWAIPYHESWFDEAQAWLIARDSTLREMVVHRLHYEGAPALWHILLWIELRIHVPFLGMHYIAGGLAALGVYLWLRYSPLPRVLTLLVPFTYFILYQYAVIARSYTLCPLFVVALLILYQNRKSSPMVFCVVAGLFANCSLHMAAFSAGLVLLYGYDRLRTARLEGDTVARRVYAAPALVLLLLFFISAATAVPTADGSSTTANPVVGGIRKLIPHGGTTVAPQKNYADLVSISAAPAPPAGQGAIATKIWQRINLGPEASHRAVIVSGVMKHILILMTALTVPISTSNLLAAVFLILLVVNVARARLWLTLVPYALVQVCNVLVSGEAHHLGLLWIAVLGVLWVLAMQPVRPGRDQLLRIALYAVVLLVTVLQIGWSVHSVRADIRGPYSGSVATANFLAHLPKEKRVAAFDDDSVTVNAYLFKSPYFNQRVDYWPFSKTMDPSLFLDQTMATRPDVVILKMATPDSPVMNQWLTLAAPGTVFIAQAPLQLLLKDRYHETHRFCGHRFFRNTSESTDCRLVFEPSVTEPLPSNP